MITESEYKAVCESLAFGCLTGRTLIEVTGEDRKAFLHNLCTGDVKSLVAGSGCEAFFTNVQGKTLCHALLFCTEASIVISTDSGLAESLLTHLDKYLIREDVQLLNRSAETRTYLVVGPGAKEFVRGECGRSLADVLEHGQCKEPLSGFAARVPYAKSNSFFVMVDEPAASELERAIAEAGGTLLQTATLEWLRIDARFPSSGIDLTIENLPQEIDRDSVAISFTKGCYLGQETVARIDALGRVNKKLVGLVFEGSEIPAVGSELRAGEKIVGRITSACWCPERKCPIGLGFIRRESLEKGEAIDSDSGAIQVLA